MQAKLVEVIPLSRGVFRDSLTYFTAREVSPGAIVSVPVRGKNLPALVLTVTPAELNKTALKKLNYDLKKIKAVLVTRLLQPAFVDAARRVAAYQAAPLAAVLGVLLPQALLSEADKLAPTTGAEVGQRSIKPEKILIQDSDEERFAFYKSLVREQFAKNHSVLVCLPSKLETEQMAGVLEKGIAGYLYHFHPQLSKKELVRLWNEALQNPHPILIVATPQFLALPRADLRTIILDRENSPGYRGLARPFIDFRVFSEFLAEATGAKLIWGDLLLRVETTYKLAAGPDWTAGSFKQRLVSAADSRLVAAGAGEILSEEVKTVVANAVRHNERTFVLASRRGLAPMVICVDCDELVQCQNCHTPMVLHESRVKEGIRETNIFRCHKCGLTRTSAEKCQFCGSWRLKELGLGIERVAEALAASFPELKIYQLDSDRVASRSRAEALVKKFLAAPGAVLLGTEMALYYLKEKVENGLAVGVDGLLALPDFRVREKLFRSLSRLRSLASKNFAIQTRQPDSILFGQIAAGNLSDFYREEIRDRKELSYPPFRLFIKITLAGTESAVAAGVAKLSESLAEYEPVSFAAFPPKVGRTYRSHLLLRLSPGAWPEPRLVERLRALPPAITVTVDPETLT